METLQIEGQTNQAPLTGGCRYPAQRELAEAQDFFDDANDRFDSALAQAVDGFANLGPELVGHLDSWTGILWRRCRLLNKVGLPVPVMGFASRGNIGVDASGLHLGDIAFAKVTIVQRCRFWLSQFSRDRIQCGNRIPVIVGQWLL